MQFKAWVEHAKYDQADTSAFADKTFQVAIHNPKGEKVYDKDHTTDDYGGLAGEFPLPKGTTLGVYRIQVVDGRKIAVGGGSFRVEEYKKPEFEVDGRGAQGAGATGRQGQRHRQGEILFRRSGDQREGEVQGAAHQLQPTLVSARQVGLVLRPRLLVVRRAIMPGIPAGASGAAVGRSPPWWGRRQEQPEVVLENEVADRCRWHRQGRHRHGAGQGAARRSGPQVLDHRRGGGRVAPHHRRHGRRAGGAQAVQGLRLARPRPLSRRRHDQRPASAPRRSTASRSRARAN